MQYRSIVSFRSSQGHRHNGRHIGLREARLLCCSSVCSNRCSLFISALQVQQTVVKYPISRWAAGKNTAAFTTIVLCVQISCTICYFLHSAGDAGYLSGCGIYAYFNTIDIHCPTAVLYTHNQWLNNKSASVSTYKCTSI